MSCWSCGTKIEANNYARADICTGCRRDTRVCKNCTHYDPKLHNECKETQADRIVDKEKSNFCDYFLPRTTPFGSTTSTQNIRAAAEALFKKK